MVAFAMAIQDQSGDTRLNAVVPAHNGIPLNASLHTGTTIQPREPFSGVNDYCPKARKPYTIKKQRERWTEEEHRNFLEALKLYGRAWRRIEEHVGTKTAVQIRSHAQKFFSKVVRDSSGSPTGPVEHIEIPPPRPKRKPVHPYPRKTVNPINKESLILEQPLRSSSPNLWISEQEDLSPKSVLSAVGSDVVSTDSNTPNRGSLSPISSAGGVLPVELTLSRPMSYNESPRPVGEEAKSSPEEQFPEDQKLSSIPNECVVSGGYLADETSTRCLKLFGITVVVAECHRSSTPTSGNTKLQPCNLNEGKPGLIATEQHFLNKKCNSSDLLNEDSGAVYHMQLDKAHSGRAEASLVAPLPYWTFYKETPFIFVPFRKQEGVQEHVDSDGEKIEGKKSENERSWTGSDSGSVNQGGNADKIMEDETQSNRHSCEEKDTFPVFRLKTSESTLSFSSGMTPGKPVKGFVPYKKRRPEIDGQSSTVTGEERAEPRVRLCL